MAMKKKEKPVKKCQGYIRLGCTADENGKCYSCGRPMGNPNFKIPVKKAIDEIEKN